MSVVGVTKCICAEPRISRTMRDAGIRVFGDSRLNNLKKHSDNFGHEQELMMLRGPMTTEVEELINICGTSLNTQHETVKLISDACEKYDKTHKIIVMVETDDEREGLLPEDVQGFCRRVLEESKNVEIAGLGTNARCINKKGPTRESSRILVSLKNDIERVFGISLSVLSGGNSSIWKLIEKGDLPPEINHVRIGEAIFFGHETASFTPISGTIQDSFQLEASIIEVKKKNKDAYRFIIALGMQDIDMRNMSCVLPGISIVNQSSDHTVLEVSSGSMDSGGGKDFLNLAVGGIISFNLNYFGLLSCMTSAYVKKVFTGTRTR
ncbi:MAG: alanine racemase [Actinobacteria bacterium]|nr:alanine racemase [Actinomycetota bacterium]